MKIKYEWVKREKVLQYTANSFQINVCIKSYVREGKRECDKDRLRQWKMKYEQVNKSKWITAAQLCVCVHAFVSVQVREREDK